MRVALCTRHLADMSSLNVIGSLAEELGRHGHTPFLYAGRPKPSLSALRALKSPVRILPEIKDTALARSLAKAVSQDKVDLIHLRVGGTHRNPFVWGLSLLSQLKRPPRLSLQLEDFGHPDLPPDCPRTARDLGELVRGPAYVTAVSRAVRDRIVRCWPEALRRTRVIGNGVDLDWASRGNGRRPFSRPYILSVGRQAPYKGMDLLVFAFADIADKFPVDLVIAGPDMENGRLRRLVSRLQLGNRVKFLGFMEHRKIPTLLRNAEFFVLASRWDAFGIAALEAMAAGVAVIAPRVGGFVDYIKDRRTGRLFSPGDLGALASAMRQLLLHPAEARSLGAAARVSARARSWTAVAGQYLKLWSSASPE